MDKVNDDQAEFRNIRIGLDVIKHIPSWDDIFNAMNEVLEQLKESRIENDNMWFKNYN